MTDEQGAIETRRQSAFMSDERQSDLHIVDQLIRERCPTFVNHWTWPVVRPVLYGLLNYRNARAMADHLLTLNGEQSFDYLSHKLRIRAQTDFMDRVPRTGRVIVASNHPTGLADGVAVWEALREVRKDIVFFANADAIRVNPRFSDAVIPVEWVADKRSPAKTRETLRLAAQAFAEEKCVVIFPSGRLAKMRERVLTEEEWMPTVVSLARKQGAPIIPLHLHARNSAFYYFLSTVNSELRDIALFHELLNKKNAHFEFTFGPRIAPDTLLGDTAEVTTKLREHVAYRLGDDPHLPFEQLQTEG